MSEGLTNQSPCSVYTIGIAGGSGAGKSTLASMLYEALGGAQNVTYIVHDSYYRDQSHKSIEERTRTNFDHPDSLETELMIQHIREIKMGHIVQIPAYDFATHTRIPQTKAVTLAAPRPILLIEGILILCHPELVQEMDLKVFVDCEADIRLIRRMDRDCSERGRTVAQVLEQYHQTVRPMHLQYVEPSKQVADLIVHSSATSSPPTSAIAITNEDSDDSTPAVSSKGKKGTSLDVACKVLTNHLITVGKLSMGTTPKTEEEAMQHLQQQMKSIVSSLSSPPSLP